MTHYKLTYFPYNYLLKIYLDELLGNILHHKRRKKELLIIDTLSKENTYPIAEDIS